MKNKFDAFVVGGFIGAALTAFLALYGESDLRTQVRCDERWKYQRTIQDTLATVRSGCELPKK